MPAWKTFDAGTATALRERLDETNVSVESITRPLFADGDSVVLAPTLQKDAALVIISRRKVAPVITEEPVQFAPLIEEIAADVSPTAPLEIAAPVVSEAGVIQTPAIEEDRESARQEPEFTFGPTTWERVDEVASPTEFVPQEPDTRSTDPEIWDLPSQAPPPGSIDDIAPRQTPVATNNEWAEERYVASGFLGLDDYVEDEEEVARAKRPWWKRIFSD